MRLIRLLLPALAFVVWFLIEQVPVWLAPPAPWERYPELMALPLGCEASVALSSTGAARAEAAIDESPDIIINRLVEEMFPQALMQTLIEPQSVRFANGETGWVTLLAVPRADEPSLERGLLLLVNADGSVRELVHLIGGDSTQGDRCADFAPQPRGLRAQLRPYLPLLALAGYGALVSVGWLGLRWRRRKGV